VVLSNYQKELLRLNESAQNLETKLSQHRSSLVEESQTGISVSRLRYHTQWISTLIAARQDLARRCLAADDRVEEQRALLLELHRDERMLERLEEKHDAEQRREELRQLERELDQARLVNHRSQKRGENNESATS